jgi:hypothetical protein
MTPTARPGPQPRVRKDRHTPTPTGTPPTALTFSSGVAACRVGSAPATFPPSNPHSLRRLESLS